MKKCLSWSSVFRYWREACVMTTTMESQSASSVIVSASILQMHPTARLVLDEAAASQLKKADYYRWVYDNKPDWQRFSL